MVNLKRWALLGAAVVPVAVLVTGCVATVRPTPQPSEPSCAIRCAAPPPGCRYEGMVATGRCSEVTCGTIVCDEPVCSVLCLAAPPGCRYEGALTHGPCDRVTCGTLVCRGPR
jgi:hypothetical protein